MDNQTKDRVKRLLDDVEKDIENIEIYFRADTYPETYEFDFKNMKLEVSVTYINDNGNARYDLSFDKNSYCKTIVSSEDTELLKIIVPSEDTELLKTIVSSEDTELLRDFYDTICEEYLRRKAKKKDEKISSLLTELGY